MNRGGESMDLQGKVALVTGGGTGIGRAAARALAAAGASVLIGNRNVEHGEGVVRTIRDGGGRVAFHQTDMTDEFAVRALVRRAVEEFGRLDLAFNNAGSGGKNAPLVDQTAADFDSNLDINVKGVFYCLKYEIGLMISQGGGAIVNNSSIFGLKGYPGWPIYTAAKHAVVGLTKAAALENATRHPGQCDRSRPDRDPAPRQRHGRPAAILRRVRADAADRPPRRGRRRGRLAPLRRGFVRDGCRPPGRWRGLCAMSRRRPGEGWPGHSSCAVMSPSRRPDQVRTIALIARRWSIAA
jgi:NAD(P)-dependent dehydrogenase (short-subunit alcohol dehydrogenase family)